MEPSRNNPWFASTIGLAGLIVGYVLATSMNGGLPSLPGGTNDGGQAASTAPIPPPSNDTPPEAGKGAVLGKSSATVTIIEFTDYQCPFCSRHFTQTFGQIKKEYVDTGKVKYESRNFPLSFHPNAQKAAESAECALDQNKFWEMHDKLFTGQDAWSPQSTDEAAKTFKKYASELGLNAGTFATCLDSGAKADMIAKDTADGSAAGISGTPGFWVLGPGGKSQKIEGAYPFASFQAAFDAMLK